VKVLQNKRIFIVEDDSLNRLVFRLALTKAGAIVEFDSGGQNSLSVLQKFAPVDIILLDLMLARGQNGYDLFKDIRALSHFANTPIVAVSATDPSKGIARAKTDGFNGFIPKPIDSDLFPQQLAHILEGNPIWEVQAISALSKFGAVS
jgi:CheY-like chemotaxis protein